MSRPRFSYMARLGDYAHAKLKPSHSAVAACLLDGMDNADIMDATGFAYQTVERHLYSLRKHLGCPTTRALCVKLARMDCA
jgi:DNA-binding CsgD family transcriptional regulator